MSNVLTINNLKIGGGNPIVIQSMTNTDTMDIDSTVNQILEMENEGCELVRIALPDLNSCNSIRQIKKNIHIPLIGDIHFDYRIALKAIDEGIDSIRINPGNIKNKKNIKEIISALKSNNIPSRIGVNTGSIDRQKYPEINVNSVINSAIDEIKLFEDENYYNFKISLKSSDVDLTIKAYELFNEKFDYPLHLGVTEAGTYDSCLIKSSYVLGYLLKKGIGDTIRISLTGNPVKEIPIAKKILKYLNLRNFGPKIISCPTCARCCYDLFPIVDKLEHDLSGITKNLTIAVMGCVVNGPGEASMCDLGIAGDKFGNVFLFKQGSKTKLNKNNYYEEFLNEIIHYDKN